MEGLLGTCQITVNINQLNTNNIRKFAKGETIVSIEILNLQYGKNNVK